MSGAWSDPANRTAEAGGAEAEVAAGVAAVGIITALAMSHLMRILAVGVGATGVSIEATTHVAITAAVAVAVLTRRIHPVMAGAKTGTTIGGPAHNTNTTHAAVGAVVAARIAAVEVAGEVVAVVRVAAV